MLHKNILILILMTFVTLVFVWTQFDDIILHHFKKHTDTIVKLVSNCPRKNSLMIFLKIKEKCCFCIYHLVIGLICDKCDIALFPTGHG